ncbi:MAG: type II secretion system GspH family protein [Proteobacteria bacterium]|nr:type II secretion system protein [Desulfobacteraceae bacterium]MBU4012895.1 type II secretion system GspH family protein [Pseudomonadota bacterium]MBU4100971.1 type II secretion system GspH family protein [Pseudomonadota bacterium]MBU4128199.1 type II secretion system GspH family protein [Pseudomonadota bacterium]
MVLKNQKGITLIEMIVFIIVAAVALPVIISPVMTLIKDSTKPEKAVTANFLGQKILEVITANDFPTLTGTSSAPDATEHSPPPPPSGVVIDINNAIGSLPSGYEKTWDIYYINPVNPSYDLETEYTVSATKYVRIDVTVTDPYDRAFNYYSIVTKRTND